VFVLRRHSFPDGKNVVKQQALLTAFCRQNTSAALEPFCFIESANNANPANSKVQMKQSRGAD
jgi:hypothetical protein